MYGFASGLGAVAWVVMAEVMSTRLRSKAFGLFVSINWGVNLLIGLLTLTAIGTYYIARMIYSYVLDGLGGVTNDMDDDETGDARKVANALFRLV